LNKSLIIGACAFLFVTALAPGAFAADDLTNAQIIAMVEAGFSEDVIIEKIANSQVDLDLSTDAIIELKNKGASDGIIRAMVARNDMSKTEATNDEVESEPTWEGFSSRGISMKTLGGFGLAEGALHFSETEVKGNFGAGGNATSYYAEWSDVHTVCAKIGRMYHSLLITTNDGKTRKFKFAFTSPSESKIYIRNIVNLLAAARDHEGVEALSSVVLSQSCGK